MHVYSLCLVPRIPHCMRAHPAIPTRNTLWKCTNTQRLHEHTQKQFTTRFTPDPLFFGALVHQFPTFFCCALPVQAL